MIDLNIHLDRLSMPHCLDSWAKGIVYATFSKNKSENDDIVQTIIDEQNEQRSQVLPKKDISIYK
jgi:hypothetical protein